MQPHNIILMNIWLNLLPLTSAIIGLVMSGLFTYFFFSSKFNRRFWEQKKISFAAKAADAIQKDEMLETLTTKIASGDNFQKILPLVEEHVDHFLRVKLKDSMPMIGMLIGDRTINQLKEIFIVELQELFPSVMRAYAGQLKENIDLQEMIKQKVSTIPTESMVVAIKKEIRFSLLIAGTICGLIIGAVQWLILFSAI